MFFIRDGFKFPDLVHALRPNPSNNIQEAWRFLDFLSYHPESAHMVSRLAEKASDALKVPLFWRAMPRQLCLDSSGAPFW